MAPIRSLRADDKPRGFFQSTKGSERAGMSVWAALRLAPPMSRPSGEDMMNFQGAIADGRFGKLLYSGCRMDRVIIGAENDMPGTVFLGDTTLEAARVQWEVFRRMKPEKRLELAFSMSESLRRLVASGVRSRHPE